MSAALVKPRIAFLGECMVELYHRPGDEPGVLRRTVGGDTLNAAVYCRRALGDTAAAEVHYVTRLGDDPFGLEIPPFIAAEGVETRHVEVAEGETTGLYAISRDDKGERSFSYWRSASAARRLFAQGRDRELEAELERFDGLVYSGISLAILSPEGRERLLELAARMKAAGRIVAFDGNYRPRLWASREDAAETIARAHAVSSLSLPGLDDEQVLYADADAETATRRLLALGATAAIVKSGGEPATIGDASGLRLVPGVAAPRIVDTTSAGDSFNGAALAALLLGAPIEDAARAGHRMASAVIGEYGAIVPRDATWWPDGPLASA